MIREETFTTDPSKREGALQRLADRLRHLAASRRTEAAVLEAEADALDAVKSTTPRENGPLFVTSKNCLALLGKPFASLDGWLRRRGVERLKLAGSPAYRTVDVQRAIENAVPSNDQSRPGDPNDADAAYVAIVACAERRARRAGR